MKPPASASGLSLVELLVTLAVIGIVAAIAIPGFSSLSQSAADAKDRQNAQYVVSVAAALRAAGYTHTWATEEELLEELTEGVMIRNMTFNLSQLSPEDVVGAKRFFYVTDDKAVYNPHPEE